jgi:hypothetical protein
MKTKILGLIAGMILLGVSQASATSITYNLTPLTIGTCNVPPCVTYSLTGSITTDGTIGPLASSDITAWSVTATGGLPSPATFSGSSTFLIFSSANSAVTASATQLFFNFTSTAPDLMFLFPSTGGLEYVDQSNPPPPPPDLYTVVGLSVGSAGTSYLSESSSDFVIASTPLPATLPLFASGLGALGLLGWRRKRKAQAVA